MGGHDYKSVNRTQPPALMVESQRRGVHPLKPGLLPDPAASRRDLAVNTCNALSMLSSGGIRRPSTTAGGPVEPGEAQQSARRRHLGEAARVVRIKTTGKRQAARQLLAPHGGDDRVQDLAKPARHRQCAVGMRRARGNRRVQGFQSLNKLVSLAGDWIATVDVEHRESRTDSGDRPVHQVGDRHPLGEDPTRLLHLQRGRALPRTPGLGR